jgi:hypothetical protein
MTMILYIADPHSLFLVVANAHLIHPVFASVTSSSFVHSSRPSPLFGLLALLIWQDNINHCTHLSNWTSRYIVPSSGSHDDYRYDLTPEQQACFCAHCFPDLEQMIFVRVQGMHVAATNYKTYARVLTDEQEARVA